MSIEIMDEPPEREYIDCRNPDLTDQSDIFRAFSLSIACLNKFSLAVIGYVDGSPLSLFLPCAATIDQSGTLITWKSVLDSVSDVKKPFNITAVQLIDDQGFRWVKKTESFAVGHSIIKQNRSVDP